MLVNVKKEVNTMKNPTTKPSNSLWQFFINPLNVFFLTLFQIAIMRYLHHPNVIRLHDVFYIKQKMYLVVDLCDKGDVFDVLSESQPHSL